MPDKINMRDPLPGSWFAGTYRVDGLRCAGEGAPLLFPVSLYRSPLYRSVIVVRDWRLRVTSMESTNSHSVLRVQYSF